ncbi:UNVERIFIED_ORG: hypothetical protein GGI57_005840 [Rhizobium aethiopicum]|nr:hypothetical protein AMK05_PC00066 [Rhizobium sp. N324]ANM19963.1 hypothetical protein AMK06_PC100051 [Rhizobium sp. N541]ANM26348.1 hypothetical protein AMK07_PC100051 [Rhizobium sp. N941]OYD00615.1 hypothetical protein AMK08_PC00066 [Rhizobium sp. N4311]
MLRPLQKIAMRHQRPSAILPKNAGLRDRRAGPPGCANNHSLIGRTSTMGPQEVDQKKNQKGCSGNMLPFGHRLMHVNGLPGPGMRYKSSRTSVPWVFCRRVVQPFPAALIARIPDPGRGSNRRRMKIQWQVTSSIPWCPPILVDTSCQSSLNCRRCGENRAYDRSENIACFWRRRRCFAMPLTKYRF